MNMSIMAWNATRADPPAKPESEIAGTTEISHVTIVASAKAAGSGAHGQVGGSAGLWP